MADRNPWTRLNDLVETHGAAALVTVERTFGSAPREEGAWMAVRPDGAFHGTIGGGRLEWEALAIARETLASGSSQSRTVDRALGPDLGQCCGGRVLLLIEPFGAADLPVLRSRAAEPMTDPRRPVLLFGAGHVGRALAMALAPLPFRLRWIDSRADAFPALIPANAEAVTTATPEAEIVAAPAGAFVLVMTHDHTLDLAMTASALRRDDLPFVGLIGSATKRARFGRRLAELGLGEAAQARLVCPIGLPGIAGKEAAVIAASVAAQLLEQAEAMAPVSRSVEA